MRYFGGKGQAGVYQKIISAMPPHDVYIETHVGGGGVLERKRPARSTIVIDADADVAAIWRSRAIPGLTVMNADAAAFLRGYPFTGRELVYSDPPYVLSTRKSRSRYRCDYSDAQHVELLDVLLRVPCPVLLSGYRSPLYDERLTAWPRFDFDVLTRGHTWATESLWLNFEPPAVLHDYRYIGADYRERQNIKRKRARWLSRLKTLPASERAAMLAVLLELASADAPMTPAAPSIGGSDEARASAEMPRGSCARPATAKTPMRDLASAKLTLVDVTA